jgi:hypothetical protein
MAWWHRWLTSIFPRASDYQVLFSLYTVDAKRGAEVRLQRDGIIYYAEMEWVKDTIFKVRQGGRPIGPFATAEEAEAAATNSPWFLGKD